MFRSVIAFLLLALPAMAQDGKIRLPSQSAAISKLSPSTFYVIDSDISIIVTASPLGVVSIIEEAGPIKVRGRFADGSGGIETRTYKGKSVYFVEAATSGKCELIIIPVGAKSASEIVRATLLVDTDGTTTKPPPTPTPGKVKHFTYIATFSEASIAVQNSATLKKFLDDSGVMAWELDLVSDAKKIDDKGFRKAVTDAGNVACLILQDKDGRVIASQATTTEAAAIAFVQKYMGK